MFVFVFLATASFLTGVRCKISTGVLGELLLECELADCFTPTDNEKWAGVVQHALMEANNKLHFGKWLHDKFCTHYLPLELAH